MANHRKEKQLILFEQSIGKLDYVEAMKAVGALYYACAEEAREKEAILLFLMKEYNKCIKLLENEIKLTQLENELYVASLTFLNKFEEANLFLSEESKIGQCCSAYIQKYMQKMGQKIIHTYKVLPEQGEFFQKLFLREVILEITSVYEDLENAYIMKESGIDTTNIIDSCLKRIKSIPIVDGFIDDIKYQIENEGRFNSDLIIVLVYIYLGKINKNTLPVKIFKELDDIIFYLDLLRRINPRKATLDTVCEYLAPILNEAQRGNQIIGNYLQELYIASALYEDLKINNTDAISVIWKRELEQEFPVLLKNADTKIFDDEIRRILSNKAKIAYDAATWQYRATIEEDYGIRDAGMLCLSYMRIIELELNNIFITTLKVYGSELRILYEEKKASLKGNEKSEFINKWKICIDGLDVDNKEESGFTLEKLWYLFINLSTHRDRKNNGIHNLKINNEDEISKKCKKIMSAILNDAGILAIESGRYADMIEYDIRNKYRNPPAHTRYVCKETAFECKKYVEKTLLEINSYMRKAK